MDSLEDSGCWDFLDYTSIDHAPPALADFLWSNQSTSTEIEFSGGNGTCQENTKKRGRTGSYCKAETKACRERLRRERFNERFCELSSVLEPGRPVKTDKVAILDDAVKALNQLKSEADELKEMNEKLLEEIKCLKAEKNELCEEKLVLKADKERIKRQLKALPVSGPGFMPPPPVFPNYGYVPMWQYLPSSARDTSHDHELRPPAA